MATVLNDVGDPGPEILDVPAAPKKWEMRFTPFPEAVGLARRVVRTTLTGWGVPGDTVDTAVLITSELLTNAIRHCDSGHPVLVHIMDDGVDLVLEVSDDSRTYPRSLVVSTEAENGRGMMLIGAVSADFGARDRDPYGKTVWATVHKGSR